MNVNDATNISNTVKDLRSNIYATIEFAGEICDVLREELKAEGVDITPESLGGWKLTIHLNPKKKKKYDSIYYTQKINDAMKQYISSKGQSVPQSVMNGITNVTVLGDDVILFI